MAVVRRTPPGPSPFSPDKMHLHHRLLSIGHSHRRAVLVMYFWAALLSFGAVALSITGGRAELLVAIAVLLVVGRRRGAQPAGPPRGAGGARGGAGRPARAQPGRAPDRPRRGGRPRSSARGRRRARTRPARRAPDGAPVTASPVRAPPRSDAPWDISFLRGRARHRGRRRGRGAGRRLVAGWPAALGVLAGAAVVTAFFCLSGVVIAWAGRIDDALDLPAALGTFLVKALVFFAVLSTLPADGGWTASRWPGPSSSARCSGAPSRRAGCGRGRSTTSASGAARGPPTLAGPGKARARG